MTNPLLLIFDLDGTLIDSRQDLAEAVNATRGFMGRASLPNADIYRFVGNGALVLVQRAMAARASNEAPGNSQHVDDGDIARAHRFFLDYYRGHALQHTTLYPGVDTALRELSEAGHKMAILTNKPVDISHTILHGLGVSGLFFQVLGGDSFAARKPDPIGIHSLREATGTPAGSTWMVGDSAVDIQTARNAGVLACGLTYGFQPDTLEQVPPDVLAPDLPAFVQHIRDLPL